VSFSHQTLEKNSALLIVLIVLVVLV